MHDGSVVVRNTICIDKITGLFLVLFDITSWHSRPVYSVSEKFEIFITGVSITWDFKKQLLVIVLLFFTVIDVYRRWNVQQPY